jgi:hypothetical protein
MKRLAKAIILAAKYREESYNKKAANQVMYTYVATDFDGFYALSLFDACARAAADMGFDKRMTQPIYLLLKYTWNDALQWAIKTEEIQEEEEKQHSGPYTVITACLTKDKGILHARKM